MYLKQNKKEILFYSKKETGEGFSEENSGEIMQKLINIV